MRALRPVDSSDLEMRLFRKGLGVLAAGRDHCDECGRTPLTGERVHHYAAGDVVCDLCRTHHEDVPDRTEIVRHSERGHTVKLRARAA
jgi:uncharacterized Zn finger protein (UPF0148 family)